MKRYMWVLLPIPITLYILFMILYLSMIVNMGEAANDDYANTISNYCSDAATIEMMETGDLGMDYAKTGEIIVDPEIAVHEYGANLAIALGYQPTEDMIANVLRDHVKVLYVCGYDGYYVYQAELSGENKKPGAQNVESKKYKLQGTFKMPYTYQSGGKLYALTLNGNKCWQFDPSVPAIKRKQSSGLSADMANHIINKRVSDDMNKRITDLYMDGGNGWSNIVYLPSSLTSLSSANPITSPTVLALVDGIEGSVAFGIGGTALDETRKVAGYLVEEKGVYVKRYCYVDQLPPEITKVNELFDSIDDAAGAGYHPDPVNIIK